MKAPVKALVINLRSAEDRMTVMASQLNRLGLEFERVEATDAEQAAGTGSAAYWNTWERPLKDTEKACLLSHMACWQKVKDSGRPALVLEDDAVLSRHVPELLAAAEGIDGIGHLTLEVRKRRKIVAKAARPLTPHVSARRLYQDRSGAAAYVLWPAGAAALLASAEKRAGLADAVICRTYGMQSYQAEPACAVQLDRCADYGISEALAPRSSIDAGKPAGGRRGLRFRLRRLGAQARMGLRGLQFAGRAERREVRLNPDDFKI